MAPATRIVVLLVTVAALPFLPVTALLPLMALAVLSAAVAPPALRTALLKGVWRIRWLLLAIFILYAFLSPGDGIPWLEAAGRAAVLVCAVTAVQVALYGVPPQALADGLSRIVPSRRFAERLVLTLEAVPEVQTLIAESRHERNWLDRAARVFAAIEAAGRGPRADAQNRARN